MARKLPAYIKNHLSVENIESSVGLLQLIEKEGTITQMQAAKSIGLAKGTCNLHFQKLEHLGLIRRAHVVYSKGRGRSTIIWELEQTKNFCLSLVFDIPFFQVSLVDFSGQILLETCKDMSGTKDPAILKNHLKQVVKEALACARRAGGCIRQVFVGLPGILEPDSGMVVKSVNFPVVNGMDFKKLLRSQYDLPCYCGSLGQAFYYGEIESLPPGTRTLVLYWDLGVGAIAGVGERIISHHRSDLFLSEFGHVRIERHGHLCHCGRRGCLEAYAGGWAMIEMLKHRNISTLDQLMKLVLSGDAAAVRIANDAAYRLGRNLYWVQQVMQSERLIISGPLSVIFPAVRTSFFRGLSEMYTDAEIKTLDPQASRNAETAMQRGAFRLARRQFFYPEKSPD